MIDLNSSEYNMKEYLSKDNVLKHIDAYSIFRYYVGDFTVNGIMKSPFRTDNKPSFGIFYSKRHNCLLYKDLATGVSGDCFSLISDLIYPTFTYLEGMAQAVVDFGIQDHFVMPRLGFSPSKKKLGILQDASKLVMKRSQELGISARPYTMKDYRFWAGFGIDRGILRRYNVVPISHFIYGKNVFKTETYAYAYIERKDNKTTYKIYQPFSTKIKFFTDMDSSIHAGYTQLPPVGPMLLITKSLKDVMAIVANTEYNAISVLSETVLIKDSVIDEYKERFGDVAVFFDNDKAGQKMAEEYHKLYDLPTIEVTSDFKGCKDFSDVVHQHGKEKAKNMLDTELFKNVLFPILDNLPF